MNKPRVLFLCTGNSCRSQMAEAFLRKYAGDQFEVYSAGLEPKTIHPMTIKVMEEIGFDMSSQYSKPLTLYLGKVHFGYLITVCSDAEKECPIFPGMGMRLHWPFEDPARFAGTEEEKLEKFREVRNQIDQKVHEWALEVQRV
ncbi:MAG: arsenate reductase ArsC [Anaerolineaceae bacterium]|nr:arsenate reductase ArsC [Anaerolineaceae bacterium]